MEKSKFNLAVPILGLPRSIKRLIALTLDLCFCVLTVFLALYLRLGEFVALSGSYSAAVVISVLIALPIFSVAGLYRAIFRYSGGPALRMVVWATGIYGLIYTFLFTVIGVQGVPRTFGIIQPILLLLFVGLSRAMAAAWLGDHYLAILRRASRPKVLIYGAGSTGRQTLAAMASSREIQFVGFLDDDQRLHGHSIDGTPVYDPADLENLVLALSIDRILLAMPSLKRPRRNEILSRLAPLRVAVSTLPSIGELAAGKVSFSDMRELDIDDLLGRESIVPNHILLSKSVIGRVVMVTGAGGSIGSELCRQILGVGPSKLLLIDQNEFALYNIHEELVKKCDGRDIALFPLLADVKDAERMREIISTWCPYTIYHAAAYKHVPLVEHNPAEGIKNNVWGTLNVAQIAAEQGVSNFVLISTDKAVRPTNIMGASKRLAENMLQSISASGPHTKFSIVRFGNVLGSSGSVVPKFRQQIRDGGPVTLTHSDITRFFMTVQEAAQLVIQAGAMAKGGDLFLLDMGKPIKIRELALRMINLQGYSLKDDKNPDGDIEIEVIGLRPAEKLHEELLIGSSPEPTTHPRILRAREEFTSWSELEVQLKSLEIAVSVNDVGAISLMMQRVVPEYSPPDEILDWVKLAQDENALSNEVGG